MIKKKLSVFLIILFLLTGCGNSFKPEEVTYEGTYRNNDDFSYFLYMHCIPVESANKVDCSNSDLDACLINGSDVYRYSTNGKEFYITFITTIGKSFKTFPVKEGYSKNIVDKDDYFSYTDLTKDYLIYDNYLLDKNAPEEVIHYIEKDISEFFHLCCVYLFVINCRFIAISFCKQYPEEVYCIERLG